MSRRLKLNEKHSKTDYNEAINKNSFLKYPTILKIVHTRSWNIA